MKDEKKVPPLPNIRTLKTFFFFKQATLTSKWRNVHCIKSYSCISFHFCLVQRGSIQRRLFFFFFYTLGVSQTQQSDKDIALKFISCFILHVWHNKTHTHTPPCCHNGTRQGTWGRTDQIIVSHIHTLIGGFKEYGPRGQGVLLKGIWRRFKDPVTTTKRRSVKSCSF